MLVRCKIFLILLAFCNFDSLKRLCNTKNTSVTNILSGVLCSWLTRADEASSALSRGVKNIDGHSGEWL